MADDITVQITVTRSGRTVRTSVRSPMSWSGDSRRHRAQIREIVEDVTSQVVAQLKLPMSSSE